MPTEQLRVFSRLDRGKSDVGDQEYAWVPRGLKDHMIWVGRWSRNRYKMPEITIVVFLEGWLGCI
jgi:hypothetical protein